jgi:hypothetical protein
MPTECALDFRHVGNEYRRLVGAPRLGTELDELTQPLRGAWDVQVEIVPGYPVRSSVHDTPCGRPEWASDNPTQAASEFAARHSDFVLEEPKWRFNESELDRTITAWPGAWLKRIR